MKILHTSDWHIGKRLMGRERLDEQSLVLDEITRVCEAEKVELVLIAGDIFDTYTPSAEAEELFYSKIQTLAGDNRAVLLISGNHDDGTRLSAVSPLSETQGVYIVGNARTPLKVQKSIKDGGSVGGRKTYPIRSGKGYAVFENDKDERVFISTLPYPNEARFKEAKSELSYIERMKGWMDEGVRENTDNLPSVFMAHIFVVGGKVSDSEREIDLGGARAIPQDALPKCDYIALGHLHKKQKMGAGHCYYSGSPLQYSFDESADKGVKVFDLNGLGVQDLKDIPLSAGRKLIRLQSETVENALDLLDAYKDYLVELTLVLSAPLCTQDAHALAQKENLVSLLTEIQSDETLSFESRKGLTDSELFDSFYKANYNAEPKAELKELFLTTLAEVDGGGV